MTKTCLIIQSGAMGDIFVLAPIAKFYSDKGYLVYWPVREQYYNLVKTYLPYVHPTIITEDKFPRVHQDWLRSDTINLHKVTQAFKYDLIIDTSDRGVEPMQKPDETFEKYKYRAAGVPFNLKYELNWRRDKQKENDLKAVLEANYDIDFSNDHYVVAHLESSHGDKTELPADEYRKVIYVTAINGFEIPDWYGVITGAKAVYAVESSVQQFVDGAMKQIKEESPDMKFYLLSRSSLKPGERYTESTRWSKKYMK